jgi:hypothetical protein
VLHQSSLLVNQVSDAFRFNDCYHLNVVFVLGFPHSRLDLIQRHGEVHRYLVRASERTRHNDGICCTSKTHRKKVIRDRNLATPADRKVLLFLLSEENPGVSS